MTELQECNGFPGAWVEATAVNWCLHAAQIDAFVVDQVKINIFPRKKCHVYAQLLGCR
jgi:hypothetical protein